MLRTYAPLTVSRHGAIYTRSLASELADSLRLIIKHRLSRSTMHAFTFYQMRIENRIRNLKRKKLFLMCLLELRMFKPEGHITFWRTRSGRRCIAQNACIFQNVSSTFARFIGEAKGDIRISQLHTSFKSYYLFSKDALSYFTNKKCLAFARHCIYTPMWRKYASRPSCCALMLPLR